MIDWLSEIVAKLVAMAAPILLALTVHEASHAWVANRLGDPTAKMMGRISLNPLRHLDPMGTAVFFITAWLGAGVGWAKPVPVDGRNLKDPRRDMMLISASGPVSNLLTASIVAVIMNLLINSGFFATVKMGGYEHMLMEAKMWLGHVLVYGVMINTVLAFFNLLPLPPLDGSGILMGLLPARLAARYHELSRYGFMILFLLIFLPQFLPGFPSIISALILAPAKWFANLVLAVQI